MSEASGAINRTGVYATEEEYEELRRMMERPAPYIVAGPMDLGPKSPQQRCHEMALAHGLPEIPGYYGMLLDTREFVTT